MNDRVSILIADDHAMVRHGLRAVIEERPGWTVCAEATNGREAVEKARQWRPQVAILDFSMPELNGLEAMRQMLAASPDTRPLMLTMHETDELVREAIAAGARGFVLKSDAGRVLITAVEALLRGKTYFTARVSELVPAQGDAPESVRPRLSPREREIVQLIAEGKSTKEVAVLLGISVKTADVHRTNLMRKLDAHSVSDIVRYAIRNRIVEP
jgi:DNA-binding NarL/FixJ family response regulator